MSDNYANLEYAARKLYGKQLYEIPSELLYRFVNIAATRGTQLLELQKLVEEIGGTEAPGAKKARSQEPDQNLITSLK